MCQIVINNNLNYIRDDRDFACLIKLYMGDDAEKWFNNNIREQLDELVDDANNEHNNTKNLVKSIKEILNTVDDFDSIIDALDKIRKEISCYHYDDCDYTIEKGFE